MHQHTQNRREFEDLLLEARLAAHVAKQLRPACAGAQRRHFKALVAAIVGREMRGYAGRPPS